MKILDSFFSTPARSRWSTILMYWIPFIPITWLAMGSWRSVFASLLLAFFAGMFNEILKANKEVK